MKITSHNDPEGRSDTGALNYARDNRPGGGKSTTWCSADLRTASKEANYPVADEHDRNNDLWWTGRGVCSGGRWSIGCERGSQSSVVPDQHTVRRRGYLPAQLRERRQPRHAPFRYTLLAVNPWWAVDLLVTLYVAGVKFTNLETSGMSVNLLLAVAILDFVFAAFSVADDVHLLDLSRYLGSPTQSGLP